VETPAFAHEDYISAFDYPAHLALTNLLYALAGIAMVFALRAFAPKMHIAVRLAFSSILPFFFWVTVFWAWWGLEVTFPEGVFNVVWAVFSTEFAAMFTVGIIVICAVGVFDHRQRTYSNETGRYAP